MRTTQNLFVIGLVTLAACSTDDGNDQLEPHVSFDNLQNTDAVAEIRDSPDGDLLGVLRWNEDLDAGFLEILADETELSVAGVPRDDRAAVESQLVSLYTEYQNADGDLDLIGSDGRRSQRIRYHSKKTTTDFRGMGQHLQYFPSFGLNKVQTNERTNCNNCIESTPDFANFTHHSLSLKRRTFSPDAGGNPLGVKTAGGFPTWDRFTLPSGQTGLSGVVYDTSVCGGSNNFVNQMRINTGNANQFCLNLITDNTSRRYDPNTKIEARSDRRDLVVPGLSFDGKTDVHTFRYTGMGENDRVKIRIADTAENCPGAGLGGIMVSHIDTCPENWPIGDARVHSDGLITGWACDKDTPNTPIIVRAYNGSEFVTGVRADLAGEAAIGARCKGNSAHRFRIQLPASLRGKRITMWGINAPGTPGPHEPFKQNLIF